jgi:hypothetical protein
MALGRRPRPKKRRTGLVVFLVIGSARGGFIPINSSRRKRQLTLGTEKHHNYQPFRSGGVIAVSSGSLKGLESTSVGRVFAEQQFSTTARAL